MARRLPSVHRAQLAHLSKFYSPETIAREVARVRSPRRAGRPPHLSLYALAFWAAVESKRGGGHSAGKSSKLVAKDLDKYWIEDVPWETIRRLHRESGYERLTAELLGWLKTPCDGLELMRIRHRDGSRVPIVQRNQDGVILPVLTKDWRHWLPQK